MQRSESDRFSAEHSLHSALEAHAIELQSVRTQLDEAQHIEARAEGARVAAEDARDEAGAHARMLTDLIEVEREKRAVAEESAALLDAELRLEIERRADAEARAAAAAAAAATAAESAAAAAAAAAASGPTSGPTAGGGGGTVRAMTARDLRVRAGSASHHHAHPPAPMPGLHVKGASAAPPLSLGGSEVPTPVGASGVPGLRPPTTRGAASRAAGANGAPQMPSSAGLAGPSRAAPWASDRMRGASVPQTPVGGASGGVAAPARGTRPVRPAFS